MKPKIVVPEGMLKAAVNACYAWSDVDLRTIEAALLWLSENPIVPTDKQVSAMSFGVISPFDMSVVKYCIAKWQRRMFLAPEPDIRREVEQAARQCAGLQLTPDEREYLLSVVKAVGGRS